MKLIIIIMIIIIIIITIILYFYSAYSIDTVHERFTNSIKFSYRLLLYRLLDKPISKLTI